MRLTILQKHIIKQTFFSAYFNFLKWLRPWEVDSLVNSPAASEVDDLQPLYQKIDWLCSSLRVCPYWSGGHLTLARTSLEINNPELAYASVLAYEALCERNHTTTELLGDCFLQLKDTSSARKFYKSIYEGKVKSSRVRESLVACELLDGNWEEVLSLLSEVSKQELSVQEVTALNWAEGKRPDA